MGLSQAGAWIARQLTLPVMVDRDVDDPQTTVIRREIITRKRFLKRIYDDWYDAIATALPRGDDPILEIGSGAGFMQQRSPQVIASDILHVPGIDIVIDATRLPFEAASLRGVVMTNVLHHIQDLPMFFGDAARCVRSGGALVMIEPWLTPWSRFVYSRLHPEPFEPDAREWSLATSGPLSAANGALPWIIFARDRQRFEREFPTWHIASVEPMMPFRYLASGGVSLRPLAPAASYPAWKLAERALGPWMSALGMFARIVVIRTDLPWR